MSQPLARHLAFPPTPLAGRPRRFPHAAAAARSGMSRIAVWVNRYRQRRVLRELSNHLLDDIGVSRKEALREAAKPFWR